MAPADALRRYLGWCPSAEARSTRPAPGPGGHISTDQGGADADPTAGGWWHRYHHQLLVMAVLVSSAMAAAFLRHGSIPDYHIMIPAIAIGLGVFIGLLASQGRRYDQVACGEFVGGRGDRRERIIRYLRTLTLSVPATCVGMVAGVALVALLGGEQEVLIFLLGMSMGIWTLLGITVAWERRHRLILVTDGGSYYTVSHEERDT